MDESPREALLQAEARLYASMHDAVLFRNHRGKYRTADGRWIETGLTKGASDLIGWRCVIITPAMVGQRLAQFVAIECKTGRREPTEQQEKFLAAVSRWGGAAGVARRIEDVQQIVFGRTQPRAREG